MIRCTIHGEIRTCARFDRTSGERVSQIASRPMKGAGG
jgi:hypothetical protein